MNGKETKPTRKEKRAARKVEREHDRAARKTYREDHSLGWKLNNLVKKLIKKNK